MNDFVDCGVLHLYLQTVFDHLACLYHTTLSKEYRCSLAGLKISTVNKKCSTLIQGKVFPMCLLDGALGSFPACFQAGTP